MPFNLKSNAALLIIVSFAVLMIGAAVIGPAHKALAAGSGPNGTCLPRDVNCTPPGTNSSGATTSSGASSGSNNAGSSAGSTTGKACTPGGKSFFGLPHWYQYLKGEDDGAGTCTPVLHSLNDFWPVILAVGEILLRVAGIIAVAFIVYAGFDYVTSAGEPEKASKARKKIVNALVGLLIVSIAASVVAFIGNHLSGGTTGLGLPDVTPDSGTLHDVLTVVFTILGALAFLMIIISGLQYVLSQGDPTRTARARNTIIYAGVGLAVAVLAQTIVNFVLKA